MVKKSNQDNLRHECTIFVHLVKKSNQHNLVFGSTIYCLMLEEVLRFEIGNINSIIAPTQSKELDPVLIICERYDNKDGCRIEMTSRHY